MNADTLNDIRSSNSPLDTYAASRDLWPGGTLDFWQGRKAPQPARVFWPHDSDQVLRILKYAAAESIPVVPYGAGSGVCGGARGQAGSFVIDMKGMQDIGPLDERRWTVDAEAGVNGQHLEDFLQDHGFTLGHSPSSIWCSTVGGWAAARSAGQFSSKYGVFEDMVLGLEAVSPGHGVFGIGDLGDGPASWMPMMLGSEGTLGAITKVRMRIWPRPESRWLRGYRFPSVDSALRAMRQLMQNELWPAVVRLYDPVDTQIGGRTKPKKKSDKRNRRFYRRLLSRVDKLSSVHKRTLALPMAMPGVVNRVFSRMASGCLVIVGWEGKTPVVEAQSRAGHLILTREGEDLGVGPGERWYSSRHAISYKLMPLFLRGGFADTMEVGVRWSEVENTYNVVRQAIARHAVVMAHMSHVYPEGAAIYFSFAGAGNRDAYRKTWEDALAAVLASGSTVTHHHGVGFLKSNEASAEVGPAIAGWKAMKAAHDPSGILNPNRLFKDVPYQDPGPPQILNPNDGVVRKTLDEEDVSIGPNLELMWPWEGLSAPPRWHRLPWQVPYTEVTGKVHNRRVCLGRGPRSASGPDLRSWVCDNGSDVALTMAVAKTGETWMGEGSTNHPWATARELLRNDLRPSVLTVVDGVLRVGFRGPASRELGDIASSWVPGGLREVPYQSVPLPRGPLEFCSMDDPDIVSIVVAGALKRADGGSNE
ncbi:MAG: FAD-binding oxidoreductase [Proteobacteria bacterium]|nr:FAD-binding oxidoreductase [Pseudomonadota bacterium]